MWIEETKTGYRLVERYTDPLTNKKRKVSVKLEKKTPQAINKATVRLNNIIQDKIQVLPEVHNMTLGEAVDEFKKIYYATLKPATIRNYNTVLNRFLNHFDKDINVKTIDTRSLNIFFNGLKDFKTDSILVFKAKLTKFFDFLISTDILQKNPMNGVIIPKKDELEENKKYLTADEIDKLLEYTKDKNSECYDAIKFLLSTGLRIGELAGLTFEDVDFDNKRLRINKQRSLDGVISTPKTKNSRRTIDLTDKSIELLKERQKGNNTYIFSKNIRRKITVFTKKASIDLGFKVTAHMLRHTHVSILAEIGVDVKSIMERLGHKDMNTTLGIYMHVTENMQSRTLAKLNEYENR